MEFIKTPQKLDARKGMVQTLELSKDVPDTMSSLCGTIALADADAVDIFKSYDWDDVSTDAVHMKIFRRESSMESERYWVFLRARRQRPRVQYGTSDSTPYFFFYRLVLLKHARTYISFICEKVTKVYTTETGRLVDAGCDGDFFLLSTHCISEEKRRGDSCWTPLLLLACSSS